MCTSRPRAASLLLLLLWACLWVETAGVGGQQEQWGSCHDLVCREVQTQMEGMIRLKRMRNYVLQTMHVMKTLLTSLDAEVFETRQGITRFIGNRCPAVHALLEDFNEEFEEDNLQTTGQVQGSLGHTTSQGPTFTITQETDEDEDQSWPQIQQSTGSPTNNVQWSGAGSGRILEVTSTQPNGEQTNKFDPTNTSQQETTKHPKMFHGGHGSRGTVPGSNNNNSGGTGSGYGGADSVSSGTNSTWGNSRTVWTTGGSGESNGADEAGGGRGRPGKGHGGPGRGPGGPGKGPGGPGGREGSTCRGVSPDSQHWVMGLDTWCLQNCPVGNCPAEYCVC